MGGGGEGASCPRPYFLVCPLPLFFLPACRRTCLDTRFDTSTTAILKHPSSPPHTQHKNRYVDARGRTHCGIIYCLSRNEAESLAQKLSSLPQPRGGGGGAGGGRGGGGAGAGRLRVAHYHASLSAEERERVQAAWTRDELQVIVATIAFGMGARARAWALLCSARVFCLCCARSAWVRRAPVRLPIRPPLTYRTCVARASAARWRAFVHCVLRAPRPALCRPATATTTRNMQTTTKGINHQPSTPHQHHHINPTINTTSTTPSTTH